MTRAVNSARSAPRGAVVLRPSAKINLTLHVGERRADGFHDVRTLLQSIGIADTLTITGRPGPFALETSSADVPADRTNLIWRAAAGLWRALGRAGEPRGARVALDKQIPVAAGLGGGSADAAAALVGLNAVWRGSLSIPALVALGAELGSDVPFFLQGGTALGVGRGDELYPMDDVRRTSLIIIKPSFGVAAGDAYRWLDEDRAAGVAPQAPRPIDLGWPAGPLRSGNDLEGAVSRRHPDVAAAVEACLAAGAVAAAMTGSGSAVFGLFAAGTGRRAYRRLARPGWRTFLTRTLTRREAGRRMGL